jgi:hypothetical protein
VSFLLSVCAAKAAFYGSMGGISIRPEQGDSHNLARTVLKRLRPGIAVEIRFGEAWRYEIDLDPAAFQFDHHGQRDGVQGCLRGRIARAVHLAILEIRTRIRSQRTYAAGDIDDMCVRGFP